jgi:sulfonate transport system ATP-binding protein
MLALEQVAKIYPNGTHALEALSLAVAPGAIIAVVGGSGCGKSTLLRLVCGLDWPTAGAIRLDGVLIRGPHQRIGIVFQEPR